MGRLVLCGLLGCLLGCGGRILPGSEIEAAADASGDATARVDGSVAEGGGDGRASPDDAGDARSSQGGFPDGGDAGNPNDGAPGSLACPGSSIVANPGPGVSACTLASTLFACTYASGDLCVCLSNDPAGCPPGGCPAGGSCTSLCAPNEFALYCGGLPPIPAPDGAPPAYVTYQQAPAACVQAGPTVSEGETVCCPCE
jgi:hypothetical protein